MAVVMTVEPYDNNQRQRIFIDGDISLMNICKVYNSHGRSFAIEMDFPVDKLKIATPREDGEADVTTYARQAQGGSGW